MCSLYLGFGTDLQALAKITISTKNRA